MISTDFLKVVYTVFHYPQHLSASYHMNSLYILNGILIHSYSDLIHTVQ